jgi:ABC-type transporter Mla subunit MlaD
VSNPNANRRISNFQIGLIALILTVFGFYLAFTKSIPFTGDGYQLKAVFSDAQNIRAKSPVRVAGVDVGEVTEIEHLTDDEGNGEDAAVITMKIDENAQPIREDAQMQLRPRLFLEGNLFVDVQPGSPSAEELDSGDVVPLEQTAASVQFDQVLTSLQAPVREQLQVFLKEFGEALCGAPEQVAVQEDEGCVPNAGAEGFRETFRTSPAAFGATAQVNEALLGTEPGDLAGFVRNLGSTVRALNQNPEELQNLITNFRIVTGSFAAESEALEEAIAELDPALREGRPALAKLNDAFPALRAFAREALPGVRSANKALDDATPFIGQLRKLMAPDELRGLVEDLRPAIPDLANLAKTSLPFLEETRALSSCFNDVVIPWGYTDVPSASDPAGRVFEETGYGVAAVAGESRAGDANGQGLKVLGGGGTLTIADPALTPPIDLGGGNVQPTAGVIPFELLGAQPAKQTSNKTPFRPDVACETQEPPNLDTGPAPNPPEAQSASAADAVPEAAQDEVTEFAEYWTLVNQADALERNGQRKEAEQVRATITDEYLDRIEEGFVDYRRAIAKLTGEVVKPVPESLRDR